MFNSYAFELRVKNVERLDDAEYHTLGWVLHRTDGPAVISKTKQEWYFKGKLHRTDGPAVIQNNCEYWYNYGVMHRLDGPAFIESNAKLWYKNGVLHRTDGPAVEYNNCNYAWYYNGGLHRLDGPARYTDGTFKTFEWWQNDKRHRTDGPALLLFNGIGWNATWYINGKRDVNHPNMEHLSVGIKIEKYC